MKQDTSEFAQELEGGDTTIINEEVIKVLDNTLTIAVVSLVDYLRVTLIAGVNEDIKKDVALCNSTHNHKQITRLNVNKKTVMLIDRNIPRYSTA